VCSSDLPLAHVGLAVATVVSQWLNVSLLAFFLIRRNLFYFDGRLLCRLWRMISATAVMAAVVMVADWLLFFEFKGWMGGGTMESAAGLGAIVGLGMVSYAIAVVAFGAARLTTVKGWMKRPAKTNVES